MVPIARRNLFHDKTRLALLVAGMATAVMLVLYNIGILTHALNTAGVYIEDTAAHVWVMRSGSTALPERSVIRRVNTNEGLIEHISGVSAVAPLVVADAEALPEGGSDENRFSVTIVGYDFDRPLGAPQQIVFGKEPDELGREELILDEQVAANNAIEIGDVLQINETDFQVVGLSTDTNTLSEQMAFMSIREARQLVNPEAVSYFLVQVSEPQTIMQESAWGGPEGPVWACRVCDEIEADTGLTALPAGQFQSNSVNIWFEWMGFWMLAMCAVILAVAVIVVILTVYTATIERLAEFGMLKAIGASNQRLARIVLEQALVGSTVAYVVGFLMTLGFVALMARLDPATTVDLTPTLVISTYLIVIVMASVAALLAIYKAVKVDPMIVFRSR